MKLNLRSIITLLQKDGLAVKWFDLGLMLGVPVSVVEDIRHNRTSNAKQALKDLIQYWLNSGEASWEDLACALEDMGNRRLAQSIREVLRKG